MTKKVDPIPKGYHTVTAHLSIKGAAKAIAFFKKAFGAKELCSCECPETGKIMLCELKIGDSRCIGNSMGSVSFLLGGD